MYAVCDTFLFGWANIAITYDKPGELFHVQLNGKLPLKSHKRTFADK